MPHLPRTLPRTLLRTWLTLSGVALLAATTGATLANPATATAAANPATPTLALTPAVRPGAPITLNFVQAEIDAVARAMGVLIGRHVVVDPRISGTLNLQTERPVTPAQALQLFSSALRLRGFAIVESQGLLKVVPEADARLQSGAVLDEAQVPRGQQIVTQIFNLTHENANHLVPILRPLVSAHNPINVNASHNSLIITDYADNLRRIAQIIAAFDVANATGVEVIGLQHALAGELIPVLQRLLDGDSAAAPAAAGQPAAGAAGFRTVLLPEPRSNSIIVRAANPARVALVRSLVAQLDRAPSGGAQGNIHVVHLRNANAVELAATLRAALAADSGLGGDASPAAGTAAAPAAGAPAGGAPAGGALGALRRTAAGAAVGATGAGAGAGTAPSHTGGQI